MIGAQDGEISSSFSEEDESSSSISSSSSNNSSDASSETPHNNDAQEASYSSPQIPPAAVRRRVVPAPSSSGGRSISSTAAGGGSSDIEDGRHSSSNVYRTNNDVKHLRHRRRRRHQHQPRSTTNSKHKQQSLATALYYFCRANRQTILRQIPTLLLVLCFLFWLAVQTTNVYDSISQSTHGESSDFESTDEYGRRRRRRTDGSFIGKRTPRPVGLGQQQPQQERQSRNFIGSFFGDAVDGFFDLVSYPAQALSKPKRGESLAPGCARAPWQVLNLPNCNDMHETDLYDVFAGRVRTDGGVVGAGYWRDVWLVDPRYESNLYRRQQQQQPSTLAPEGVVLKMMKKEHKVEDRNFERHRRDALTMERLTASPNIVDIYSYCGNSVLTEYVGTDMHKVLYHPDGSDDGKSTHSRPPSDRTDKEKLQLALQVIKGVADLHSVPGGPIVHADIADKQFLIDDKGQVKLNDFNRCRFMGHKVGTKEKCSFIIPSAPGKHRSPEEYNDKELTEQIDVFSTAHVLYGILMDSEPFAGFPSSQIKRAVKNGKKPPIYDEFRKPGTPTAVLADLIDRAYELDPSVRITSPEMVIALENALEEL